MIADQSMHHVAYQVAKAGFSMEAFHADYGYDGFVVTYAPSGEIDNGSLYVQLKSSDSPRFSKRNRTISFQLSGTDLDLWAGEIFPVYLVMFDARNEKAYWLYLQQYIKTNGIDVASLAGKSLTVHIPLCQVLDGPSVNSWRDDKAAILAQIAKVDHA
ncbi:MAG TPA: DUF4365 domain-containing protein [Hyphomicrobium sp.]|nr:DUF4365 domain-containing protein [Hyphomicrobium sp.]